ncbi:MAG: RHS repeat domain-containing protein, partial [Eubacteriales bacterium]
QREYKGALGWGWDFTYNRKLDFFGNGQIGYIRGNGSVEYFTPDGSGGYTPPSGYYETLVKNQDRTYSLKTRDKTTYLFDYTGRLSSISDRNGNAVKLGYDEADLLTSIQDAGGHTVTISYDTQRR